MNEKFPPVPAAAGLLDLKRGYRQRIPVARDSEQSREPCVDLRDLGIAGVNHYAHPYNPPYHHQIPGAIEALFVRQSVAQRLLGVNARLKPAGLELYLFDAWRPRAVQAYFHADWFPRWLEARNPGLTGDALREEVENYWSAPTTTENSPAPHSTGGAVDLTLICSSTRQPLWMGSIFDDVTEIAWTDWYERAGGASMSDEEARRNRRLLYWTMREAGFANNPTEWWHYSWGDQMWAALTGAHAAVYGVCQPDGAVA